MSVKLNFIKMLTWQARTKENWTDLSSRERNPNKTGMGNGLTKLILYLSQGFICCIVRMLEKNGRSKTNGFFSQPRFLVSVFDCIL